MASQDYDLPDEYLRNNSTAMQMWNDATKAMAEGKLGKFDLGNSEHRHLVTGRSSRPQPRH